MPNKQRKPALESAQRGLRASPVGFKYLVTLDGQVRSIGANIQAEENEDFKIITHGNDAGA